MPIKKYLIISFLLFFVFGTKVSAATWYISPAGNDSNVGSTEASPVKTFDKAWTKISRGDTLILLDGVYKNSTTGVMDINVPADDGQRIYIKAKNEGKAVIDGEGTAIAVIAFKFWQGGKNIELSGIVAKNAGSDVNNTSSVIRFDTGRANNANILLKKVAALDADVDSNSGALVFYQSSGITVEDCVAAGSGRKMVLLYQSDNNVIRRCVARWLQFDGRKFCGGLSWPAGSGFEIYYGNNNKFENNIGFGNVAYYHFAVKGYAATDGNEATNNKLLGNMSIYAGRYADGSQVWTPSVASALPSNTLCSQTNMNTSEVMNAYQTVGLSETRTDISNNLWQDNLAYKGGGTAVVSSAGYYGAGWSGNIMNRVTFVGNGLLVPSIMGDIQNYDFTKYSFTNSKIDKIIGGSPASLNSGKASIQNQYVNGVLTSQPLWPWPAETFVHDVFATQLAAKYGAKNPDLYDFSVTNRVCVNILKGDAAVAATTSCTDAGPIPTSVPVPTPSISPSPTIGTSSSPSINPVFDVNKDNAVNLLDVLAILSEIFK